MAGPPQLAPFDVVEVQLIINKLIIIINFLAQSLWTNFLS